MNSSSSKSRRSFRSQRKTPTRIVDDLTQHEYFDSDDLNQLRVTIPRVAVDHKGEHCFVVAVENSDEASNDHRQEQLRYYAEFYALENKLQGLLFKYIFTQKNISLSTKGLLKTGHLLVYTSSSIWVRQELSVKLLCLKILVRLIYRVGFL